MTAAIYIRKSREDKTKPGHRLTAQRQQLPAYARAQRWGPIIYGAGHAIILYHYPRDITGSRIIRILLPDPYKTQQGAAGLQNAKSHKIENRPCRLKSKKVR